MLEHKIFKVIDESKKPLTTEEIVKRSGVEHFYVFRILNVLHSQGKVFKRHSKVRWGSNNGSEPGRNNKTVNAEENGKVS